VVKLIRLQFRPALTYSACLPFRRLLTMTYTNSYKRIGQCNIKRVMLLWRADWPTRQCRSTRRFVSRTSWCYGISWRSRSPRVCWWVILIY